MPPFVAASLAGFRNGVCLHESRHGRLKARSTAVRLLYVTRIVGSVYLNLEAVRVMEFERFFRIAGVELQI